MAIPTFSFGSYASDLVSPNRVLVPTTLTAADKPVAERYKTETEAYNQAMDKYRQDVEAYNAALETWNAGPRDKEFTMATPTAPADLGYTQEDVDAFSEASASRAAAQQAAKQNALNIIMNPEGFSQQYGIGSLSFADGGDVPFFLESQKRSTANLKYPMSRDEIIKQLVDRAPVLKLVNRFSNVATGNLNDLIRMLIKGAQQPENWQQLNEETDNSLKARTNSLLEMFGTHSDKLIKGDKSEPYFYEVKLEHGGAIHEGIGSLQSRVDLGDGDPQMEREPFMLGGYEFRPNAYIEYGSGGSEEPVRMSDEETGVVRESYREGFGNIGLDVTTPGQHKFGGSASGSYTRGKVELPYGEVIRYGEGVTPERYNAYYETPGGTRLSGMYRESNPDQQRAFEIMLQKRFATDDLIDRISRFLKR